MNNSYQTIHTNNLRRAAGLGTISGGGGKYQYITDTDELTKAYMQSKADLNYALRKEVKRDRYILNRQALQQSIVDTVIQVLMQNLDILADMVAADVVYNVNAAFGNAAGAARKNSSLTDMLGKQLGRALAEAPFKLLDEIMNDASPE